MGQHWVIFPDTMLTCWHDYISAMCALWWQSCKLCTGYLGSCFTDRSSFTACSWGISPKFGTLLCFFSRDSNLTTSVVRLCVGGCLRTSVPHQNPLILNKSSLISHSSVAHQSLISRLLISCSSVAQIATFKRFLLVLVIPTMTVWLYCGYWNGEFVKCGSFCGIWIIPNTPYLHRVFLYIACMQKASRENYMKEPIEVKLQLNTVQSFCKNMFVLLVSLVK